MGSVFCQSYTNPLLHMCHNLVCILPLVMKGHYEVRNSMIKVLLCLHYPVCITAFNCLFIMVITGCMIASNPSHLQKLWYPQPCYLVIISVLQLAIILLVIDADWGLLGVNEVIHATPMISPAWCIICIYQYTLSINSDWRLLSTSSQNSL